MTEYELILSLCKEKNLGIDESNEDEPIERFMETYGDHRGFIVNAAQGDTKALRRLRWICGLKVILKTNHLPDR